MVRFLLSVIFATDIDLQQIINGTVGGLHEMAPNTMCDWTGVDGVPLLYMPQPMKADDGWFAKFPRIQGMFGTKN